MQTQKSLRFVLGKHTQNKIKPKSELVEISDVVSEIHQKSKSINLTSITVRQKDMIENMRNNGGVLCAKDIKDKRTLNALHKRGVIECRFNGDNIEEWLLVNLNADAESEALREANKKPSKLDPFRITAEEFRQTCDELFGTKRWQTMFAEAIGVNKFTVSKWVSGKLEVPVYIVALVESLQSMKQNNIPLPDRYNI